MKFTEWLTHRDETQHHHNPTPHIGSVYKHKKPKKTKAVSKDTATGEPIVNRFDHGTRDHW